MRKKRTVTCQWNDSVLELPGVEDTKVPGLAVVRDSSRNFGHKVAIIHVASGLVAATIATQKIAWETVSQLAPLEDWTKPSAELFNRAGAWEAAKNICREASARTGKQVQV